MKVNRLKNYLSSRQLAELHLNAAEECDRKEKQASVNYNLIKAVRYLITANNNLQSLAFEKRGRK